MIRAHLQGKETIGAYPLLTDDTCQFLVVDFDGAFWQEDVAAFRNTCSTLEIPVAVGTFTFRQWRSCLVLLYRASHGLSCKSHGLFPSHRNHVPTASTQHGILRSTFSQSGHPSPWRFRKLDRSPATRRPRRLGNSVFVDDSFVPYADQWAYLASLKRISPQGVQIITDQAVLKGQVIGLKLPSDHDEEQAPWERSPSAYYRNNV